MSELVSTERSNITQFRNQLTKMRDEYDSAVPAHMDVDRLNRMAFNAIQAAQKRDGDNPLLDADRRSLLGAIMTAAVLGLEPDGVTGQGYLVPFKGKVQFIVGYAGYITLAANSGILIEARPVYENDLFSFQYGTDPKINHAPAQGDQARGDLIATYAVARSHKFPTTFRVCTIAEIMRVRDSSQGYQASKRFNFSSPWDSDFEAMALKTPVRRIGKNLPLNVQRGFALEESHDQGRHAQIQPDETVLVEELESEAAEELESRNNSN